MQDPTDGNTPERREHDFEQMSLGDFGSGQVMPLDTDAGAVEPPAAAEAPADDGTGEQQPGEDKDVDHALDPDEARHDDKPAADAETLRRLELARRVQQAHREEQQLKLRKPWDPSGPNLDLERLAAAYQVPLDAGTREVWRKLLKLDVSPRVFGRTPAGQVPPFDETLGDGTVADTLWRLSIFARIDIKASLNGNADGLRFFTGKPTATGERAVTRGAPGDHPIKTRILSLLERGGLAPEWLITRFAHPDGARQTVKDHLRELVAYGLVEYLEDYRISEHVIEGKLPRLHRLTAKGWNSYLRPNLGSNRKRYTTKPLLSATGLSRVAHHVGALAYLVALVDTLPYVTDNWFTPAWADGHIDVPTITDPYARETKKRPLQLTDHARRDQWAWTLPDTPVEPIKPDGFLELRVPLAAGGEMPLPLLVEYDRTRSVEYNLRKLLKWEAWRIAWAREHPRFRGQGDHLGALLFVARDRDFLMRIMAAVDRGHTTVTGVRIPGLAGAIGLTGDTVRYYAGRKNLYFALEEDIHYGSTRVFQVPPCPPHMREHLGQPTGFQFHRTELLPPLAPDEQRKNGRGWTGLPWSPTDENH